MATCYDWTLEKIVDGCIEKTATSRNLKPFVDLIDQIDGCSDTPDGYCLGVHVLRGIGNDIEGYWGYAERRENGRLYLPMEAESMRGNRVPIPARFHVELEFAQDKIYGRPEKNGR